MENIKFRAFINNRMVRVEQILFSTEGPVSFSVGKYTYSVKTNPLMMFSGLVDKNGKEIYEDDVIQFTNFHKPLAVKYFGNGFWLHGKDAFQYWPKQELCTVIGNVHQDPDLVA